MHHAFCGIIDSCVRTFLVSRIDSQRLSVASYLHHIGHHAAQQNAERKEFAAAPYEVTFSASLALIRRLSEGIGLASKKSEVQDSFGPVANTAPTRSGTRSG